MALLSTLVLSLIGLAAAAPSSVEKKAAVSPRCGTGPLLPSGYYLLQEDQPDAYTPIENGLFEVSQSAGNGFATNRTYILLTYDATPSGSSGCELTWKLDPTLGFVQQVGPDQIDVEQTDAWYPGFQPTWNNIIAPTDPSTIVGGVVGTVDAYPGADAVVNTFTCLNSPPRDAGAGLAFVFKLAQSVEQSGVEAVTSFYVGLALDTFTGIYISWDC